MEECGRNNAGFEEDDHQQYVQQHHRRDRGHDVDLYVGFSDNTFAGNNVSGNTITNITNGNSIFGIFSDGQNQNFFNNTVSGLSATGAAAAVNGI